MLRQDQRHRRRPILSCSVLLIAILVNGFVPISVSHTAAANKMPPSNYAASPAMKYPELRPGTTTTIEYEDDGTSIRSVPAIMTYVTKETDLIELTRLIDGSDTGFQGASWETRPVRICNAAGAAKDGRPVLHRHGFELQRHLFEPRELDFLDTEQVVDQYYPSVEGFLKAFLGDRVAVVKAFDHNIRIQQDDNESQGPLQLKNTGGTGSTTQQPIGVVHGDYTLVRLLEVVEDSHFVSNLIPTTCRLLLSHSQYLRYQLHNASNIWPNHPSSMMSCVRS